MPPRDNKRDGDDMCWRQITRTGTHDVSGLRLRERSGSLGVRTEGGVGDCDEPKMVKVTDTCGQRRKTDKQQET